MLTIPVIRYDMVETTVTVLAQYLADLGWDWNDYQYLGPYGVGLPDGYFRIIQDGAMGWAPAGYRVKWMSLKEIRDALNDQRFSNPVPADRAVSLYARTLGSP